jgi:hypothetical protein
MFKFMKLTALGVGLLSIASGANAADRQVRVYNGTGQAIYELYGSASRGDHLKTSVLQDGEAMQITFEDDSGACHLDIRAELETGQRSMSAMSTASSSIAAIS